MNQRKLIKLGNSSYAIALPKDWIKKSGLKKGDNVFLEENSGGEIVLWSELKKNNEEQTTEINIGDKDLKIIRKEIVSAYTNGSTSIILTGKKEKSQMKEIKEFIKSLLSFEIIENSSEKIVAKDFFNLEESNMSNFITRIDNNIKEMFSVISSSIESGNPSQKELEELESIDIDTTKFYYLISRLFFKGIGNPSVINTLGTDNMRIFNEWWIAYNLEHVGDKVKEIAKTIKTSKLTKKDRKLISEIFSQISETYSNSLMSFDKKDKKLAINAAGIGKSIYAECDKLSQRREISIAKLGILFKELENNFYQTLKMVMYSKI